MEPLPRSVEEALTSSIAAAARPESLALEELIRNTPALRERDYLKYAKLEQTLADALMDRVQGDRGVFRARLLAAIVVSGLRLGHEEWSGSGKSDPSKAHDFTRRIFRQVWTELRELGRAGLERPQPSSRRKGPQS